MIRLVCPDWADVVEGRGGADRTPQEGGRRDLGDWDNLYHKYNLVSKQIGVCFLVGGTSVVKNASDTLPVPPQRRVVAVVPAQFHIGHD